MKHENGEGRWGIVSSLGVGNLRTDGSGLGGLNFFFLPFWMMMGSRVSSSPGGFCQDTQIDEPMNSTTRIAGCVCARSVCLLARLFLVGEDVPCWATGAYDDALFAAADHKPLRTRLLTPLPSGFIVHQLVPVYILGSRPPCHPGRAALGVLAG